MAHHLTPTELRNMQPTELQSEVNLKRLQVQKLRLAIIAGGEKDTTKLRTARREFARMLTVLNEKPVNATLPAPVKKKTTSKKAK